MPRRNHLSKKLLAIIDDLFEAQLTEQQICQKFNLSRSRFHRLLADTNFREEFARRIDWADLRCRALIARYASLAAAKLVELINSENQETSRKACLDIISLPTTVTSPKKTQQSKPDHQDTCSDDSYELPPHLAEKLLDILTQEKDLHNNSGHNNSEKPP